VPHLAMRVGIVTGEVAVTVGAAGEGMVAGDAVNTASRVQATAAPGEVWVDDATRLLTSAAIAYDDAGEHLLRGRTEPSKLCLAYGEGVAFWALAEAVRCRLGLLETDLAPIVVEQLDDGLARFVADPDEQAWLRPRLLGLVGGGTPGSFSREDLFAAWTVFFE